MILTNQIVPQRRKLKSYKDEVRRLDPSKIKKIQEKIFPGFPNKKEYDVVLLDPPWKYDQNTQKENIPDYATLGYYALTFLPIRRVMKDASIALMWSTAPMLDKAISLLKIYGFRYVTVFQVWEKQRQGKPAQIKGGYSYGSTEYLLWAEKGRTQDLKTPDTVEQIIRSEITKHSAKPYEKLFPRLMQKLHLNRIKCLEVFARGQNMKYFDVYGDELNPRFQRYSYKQLQQYVNMLNLSDNDQKRVDSIMSQVKTGGYDEQMKTIIEQYHDTFALSKSEMGKTPIAKHNIFMKQDAIPVRHRAYRCSPKEYEFMQTELDTLLKLGCIERCEANWVMPVIMVKKKDATGQVSDNDLRMCIDFRDLNKQMLIENYPIPRIDEILSILGKGKVFTKLDIKSGFWQVEINEECQKYTGFITPFGTFRWKRMPFGLKNAPATFQRIMEEALRKAKLLNKICLVYIDDIVIFSKNVQEHQKHIAQVLQALRDADLKVGVNKCEFFQTHIDILGHHISNGQISPQSNKVKAIQDIAIPENRSQIRSFVGMCSYYRSFIKDFSQKCSPLLKLTQQRVEFKWTDECQKSFETMKQELCTAPLLQTPIAEGKYILQTDFSEKGIGAVLNQLLPGEDTPRVVEYASRSLRGAEVNYPAYEGEVLAIHWALSKFRHYLHGTPFVLYTDNKALSQVLENQTKSKKIIRWIMDMQEYQFTTEHRPGKDNANADALSRLFNIPEDINIKLNSVQGRMSLQTYQTMYPGSRLEKDEQNQCNMILTEGVGDLACKKCKSTHTRQPMLICERCGQGYHNTCLNPKVKDIPKEAWYCPECIEVNKTFQKKDITMDFDCIEFLRDNLDLKQFDENKQHAIKTRASKYKYMHDRIFRIKDGNPLLVPTIAERKLLVLEQHRVLSHPSIKTLLNILKQNFYWNNMEEIVQDITFNCQVCQARRVHNLPSSEYIPTKKGHMPFHTVSMDLAPELTITKNGNRHLLVLVDNFSKYTILIPLKDKSSETLSNALFNHLICMFGTPKCFRMDQGTEFKGEVSDLAHRWGIEIARSTTYHPQSNGLAERMIQVIKRSLTAAINDPEQPLEWDQACYPIQMAINSAESRATSISPYSVLFGRIMPVPQSIIYGIPLEEFQEPSKLDIKGYHKKLNGYLKHYHKIVSTNREKVDSQNKQLYEKLHIQKQHQFQPNQLVFVKRSNASRWALPNIGPVEEEQLDYSDEPIESGVQAQELAQLEKVRKIVPKPQYGITDQNVSIIIQKLQQAKEAVSRATYISLQVQSTVLDRMRSKTIDDTIDPLSEIEFVTVLTELDSAIEDRRKTLTTESQTQIQVEANQSQDQQAPPLPQLTIRTGRENSVPDVQMATESSISNELIQYHHLCQYIQDMDAQATRDTTNTLGPQARKQYADYRIQGVVDRVHRSRNPNLPLHKVFRVTNHRNKANLTKDQLNYILERITPADSNPFQQFPVFNLDFQFDWTILFVDNDQRVWKDFHGEYRSSRIHYHQEKKTGFNIAQIEAQFAFQTGCRWIRQHFDPTLNLEFNERYAYLLANGRYPRGDSQKSARCLFARCAHTGVWDGENIYYFSESEDAFVTAYSNLSYKVYPALKEGDYKLEILAPWTLPSLKGMPTPTNYEHMIGLHSGLLHLSRSQLVEHLDMKLSPCLGFGGIYQPHYSNPKYAVTGRLINMTPRFANSVPLEQENNLFNWSIQQGCFVPNSTDVSTLNGYTEYLASNVQFEIQQQQHEQLKLFPCQTFDPCIELQYGSQHFWTWFNREQNQRKISRTPHTIYGDFSRGLNPYQPTVEQHKPHLSLILCERGLNAGQKESALRTWIDQTCETCTEMAQRYRRSQWVQGFNSPFLRWSKPPGAKYQYRFPHGLEILQAQVPTEGLNYMRHVELKGFQWIPKALANNYDVKTDTYYRSADDLLQIRYTEYKNQQNETQKRYRAIENTTNATPRQGVQNIIDLYINVDDGFPETIHHQVNKIFMPEDLIELPADTSNLVVELPQLLDAGITQVVLHLPTDSPLMEWEVVDHFRKQEYALNIKGVALRLPIFLTRGTQMLFELVYQHELVLFLLEITKWPSLRVSLVKRQFHLNIPVTYDSRALQFSISSARTWTHNNTDMCWFVPIPINPQYSELGLPGCCIGLGYKPLVMYHYNVAARQFVPKLSGNQEIMITANSPLSKSYRTMQLSFIRQHSFKPLSVYTTDNQTLQVAKRIRCPQEARSYCAYGLQSRWFTQDMQYTPAIQQKAHQQRPLQEQSMLPQKQHRNRQFQRRNRHKQ